MLFDRPVLRGAFACLLLSVPTVAMKRRVAWTCMTREQLKAFIEKVQIDPSLQARLLGARSSEDVFLMAKEHGHEFGAEHLSQLSEQELEGLSGGNWSSCICQDTA